MTGAADVNHVSGIGDEVGSALLASLGLADDVVRVEHLAGTADSACPTHSGHDSRRAAWVFNPLGSNPLTRIHIVVYPMICILALSNRCDSSDLILTQFL